jgi:hypothetical protein
MLLLALTAKVSWCDVIHFMNFWFYFEAGAHWAFCSATALYEGG